MTDIPVFETERLILRGITIEDAPAYQHLFENPKILINLTKAIPVPYPKNGALEYLRDMAIPQQGKDKWMWAICLKENPSELIGAIDLWRDGKPEHRGFWLGEPYWGKGYMPEAASAVTDYAFDKLGFEKLVFSNAVGNKQSRRIKEKHKAEPIGIKPAEIHGFTHAEYWELTKEKWQEFRSANGIKPQSPKL